MHAEILEKFHTEIEERNDIESIGEELGEFSKRVRTVLAKLDDVKNSLDLGMDKASEACIPRFRKELKSVREALLNL